MSQATFKGGFANLAVESGEESDGYEEVTVNDGTEDSSNAKPTKSALKRAQKQARQEKRLQAKAEKGRSNSPSQEVTAPSTTTNPPAAVETEAAPGTTSTYTVEPLTTADAPAVVVEPVEEERSDDTDANHASSYPTTGATTPEYPPADPKATQANAQGEREKKIQNAFTRTAWGLVMIFGFIGLVLLGHAYVIILVMICQTAVYREVTALFSLKLIAPEQQVKRDPWSKTLSWYFFAVANYFFYGESLIYYFKHIIFNAQLLPFATNHRIISFMLYMIGFVGFVVSLKKGLLRQQFGLFCWVHMSLLLFVVSCHFVVNNILEGLIWFWVPSCLVICNDVFAYVWGITLGRTPLIKLSPKKTVEGFVGAFGTTIVFAVAWGTWFMHYDYLICPAREFGVSAFSAMTCQPNPIFVWRQVELFQPLQLLLAPLIGSQTTLSYAPFQLHCVVMACFASLAAPFGGFFASGFKRAFDIKDFGQSIPGHGGMTDRMDCQFLMGVFTYVYYSSLIRQDLVTPSSVLQLIVSGLTVADQIVLYDNLHTYLQGQRLIS